MFLKSSLINFGAKVLLVIISFLTSVITARILGPSGKGILSIILLAPTILVKFGSFSLSNANIYLLGKKRYNLNEIVWNSIFVALSMGLILIIGFITFYKTFSPFLQGAPKNLLFIAIISVPFSLIFPYLFNLFLPLNFTFIPHSPSGYWRSSSGIHNFILSGNHYYAYLFHKNNWNKS